MRKRYYGVSRHSGNTGITFCDTLTIVFIVLKLTGVIDWSWLAVLSPSIISFFVLIISVLVLLAIEIKENAAIKNRKKK